MAMNKKEQAAFAELQKDLLIARALRFTDPVPADIPIPERGLAKGWLFNSYLGNPDVARACSSSVSHCYGDDNATTSQGATRLYSTKLLALRALRHAVELKCAEILAGIDLQIEDEATNGK